MSGNNDDSDDEDDRLIKLQEEAQKQKLKKRLTELSNKPKQVQLEAWSIDIEKKYKTIETPKSYNAKPNPFRDPVVAKMVNYKDASPSSKAEQISQIQKDKEAIKAAISKQNKNDKDKEFIPDVLSQWSCQSCTYLNNPRVAVCSMCESPRHDETHYQFNQDMIKKKMTNEANYTNSLNANSKISKEKMDEYQQKMLIEYYGNLYDGYHEKERSRAYSYHPANYESINTGNNWEATSKKLTPAITKKDEVPLYIKRDQERKMKFAAAQKEKEKKEIEDAKVKAAQSKKNYDAVNKSRYKRR